MNEKINGRKLEIKHRGSLLYLLGVTFDKNEDGRFSLTQEVYIAKLLDRFR